MEKGRKQIVDYFFDMFRLSEMEKEVLTVLFSGVTSDKDIGKELFLEVKEVQNHFINIAKATRISSKAKLLARYIEFLEKNLIKVRSSVER